MTSISSSISFSKLNIYLGIISLGLIMVVPAAIYQDMALISKDLPSGVYYFLWPPGFFIIDLILAAFVYLKILYFTSQARLNPSTLLKTLLGAVIVFSALLLQIYNGYFLDFYDGIIFILRVLIISMIIIELIKYDYMFAYKLMVSLIFLLFIASFVAFFIFGVEANLKNRYSLIGLGPNVSSDVILMGYSISLILFKRKTISIYWLMISLVPLVMFTPFTGSRRALFFAFILIFFTMNFRGRIMFSISLTGLIFLILNYFSFTFEDAYSDMTTIIRILETIDQINSGTFEDGRFNMYQTAAMTIISNPFGVGLSDWAIQAEMAIHGVGSHTHNFFMQMYLKFGIFAILIYAQFAAFFFFLIKQKYWFQILFFTITLNTGYGFWNLKYCTVFIWTLAMLYAITRQNSNILRQELSLGKT